MSPDEVGPAAVTLARLTPAPDLDGPHAARHIPGPRSSVRGGARRSWRAVCRIHAAADGPGAGTTAFTGLKKVSVRALRAEVKNTPYEFVFDHPDDNETVPHAASDVGAAADAPTGPHPVRRAAQKGLGQCRMPRHHDQLAWHAGHPESPDGRVQTAPRSRRKRMARHVRTSPGRPRQWLTAAPQERRRL